jgi:hypothetical protein
MEDVLTAMDGPSLAMILGKRLEDTGETLLRMTMRGDERLQAYVEQPLRALLLGRFPLNLHCQFGRDFSLTRSRGQSLRSAISSRNVERTLELLEEGGRDALQEDMTGRVPFHYANKEFMEALLYHERARDVFSTFEASAGLVAGVVEAANEDGILLLIANEHSGLLLSP